VDHIIWQWWDVSHSLRIDGDGDDDDDDDASTAA
jgi:hypothetical protein